MTNLHKPLPTTSPEAILAAEMVTPERLTNLLINNDPLPIRYITHRLADDIPCFKDLSTSKQRRLIMNALDSGDSKNFVVFKKIGWGQWTAKKITDIENFIKIRDLTNSENNKINDLTHNNNNNNSPKTNTTSTNSSSNKKNVLLNTELSYCKELKLNSKPITTNNSNKITIPLLISKNNNINNFSINKNTSKKHNFLIRNRRNSDSETIIKKNNIRNSLLLKNRSNSIDYNSNTNNIIQLKKLSEINSNNNNNIVYNSNENSRKGSFSIESSIRSTLPPLILSPSNNYTHNNYNHYYPNEMKISSIINTNTNNNIPKSIENILLESSNSSISNSDENTTEDEDWKKIGAYKMRQKKIFLNNNNNIHHNNIPRYTTINDANSAAILLLGLKP